MSEQPEHTGAVLRRALAEVEMRPSPCPPKKRKDGKREDGHRFAPTDDPDWVRCLRCGWYARPDR